MKLLLISNSTNAGEEYLRYPMPEIGRFLQGVSEIVFVPYAAVTFSYAEYEKKVQARLSELGIRVRSVHRAKDPARMVREAEALCVGGGNTFALAKKMQEQGLMAAILRKIKAGTPYVGWSAGSNVACPTICTTNDMPIVEPQSFRAVGAVKFQINPHYLDANPEGHAGETREQRILEYIEANPLGRRAARRVHAPPCGGETRTDRQAPDAHVPQGHGALRSTTGQRPVVPALIPGRKRFWPQSKIFI